MVADRSGNRSMAKPTNRVRVYVKSLDKPLQPTHHGLRTQRQPNLRQHVLSVTLTHQEQYKYQNNFCTQDVSRERGNKLIESVVDNSYQY